MHTYTCGNDDGESNRQLLLKSAVYKYLITRNVRHTHSLLVPDEQSMLSFFLIILNICEQPALFRHRREKKFIVGRQEKRERNEEKN
jgi:hypothetical protein